MLDDQLVSNYSHQIIFLDEIIVHNDLILTKHDVGYIKRKKSKFVSRKEQSIEQKPTLEQISIRNENIKLN